jgi:hypothetical protein
VRIGHRALPRYGIFISSSGDEYRLSHVSLNRPRTGPRMEIGRECNPTLAPFRGIAPTATHFSATTGTLFHDSHLPLQKWFMAITLMVEAKKGLSAKQMQRHLGVSYKTAWYLCHRIRQAMQEDPGQMVDTVRIEHRPVIENREVADFTKRFVNGKRSIRKWEAQISTKARAASLTWISDRN